MGDRFLNVALHIDDWSHPLLPEIQEGIIEYCQMRLGSTWIQVRGDEEFSDMRSSILNRTCMTKRAIGATRVASIDMAAWK